MTVSRNDPCPCGSGRKYKKCHGAAERPAAAPPEATRANALKARDTELHQRLMRFARARHGPQWLVDVLDSEGLLDEDDVVPDAEMPLVIPWLEHCRVDAAGRTLAEEWLEDQRRVAPDDLLLLEAWHSAWMSLWEVAEVQPGTGSRLRDVLTGEERFVHDVSSAATLRRFDTILAIVVTCDGVSFFGGLHGQALPPRVAETVVRAARRMCGVRTRPVAPDKLRDPDMQLDLLDRWRLAVEEMLDRPAPVLQNTDGDPLVLTRDDFALLAPRNEVARRLASLPGLQPPELEDGDDVFVVVKAGNAVHRSWDNTVIGRIVLSDARLRLETNSTRRADSLRSVIETELQGIARFRLRKEENTEQLMASAQVEAAAPEPRRNAAVPPDALAALREFREQHMRDWLDNAIPALDGLTPREAARQPRARSKLVSLLKEFEQTEAERPVEERIGLTWVWHDLGLS